MVPCSSAHTVALTVTERCPLLPHLQKGGKAPPPPPEYFLAVYRCNILVRIISLLKGRVVDGSIPGRVEVEWIDLP